MLVTCQTEAPRPFFFLANESLTSCKDLPLGIIHFFKELGRGTNGTNKNGYHSLIKSIEEPNILFLFIYLAFIFARFSCSSGWWLQIPYTLMMSLSFWSFCLYLSARIIASPCGAGVESRALHILCRNPPQCGGVLFFTVKFHCSKKEEKAGILIFRGLIWCDCPQSGLMVHAFNPNTWKTEAGGF